MRSHAHGADADVQPSRSSLRESASTERRQDPKVSAGCYHVKLAGLREPAHCGGREESQGGIKWRGKQRTEHRAPIVHRWFSTSAGLSPKERSVRFPKRTRPSALSAMSMKATSTMLRRW